MSNPAQLREGRDKPQVAYAEFLQSIGQYPGRLFCFFEGKDNTYYVPRIKKFTSDYQPIRCGNRDSVLKVHKLISNHSEYNKYKKAFFIDRDFNKPIRETLPPIFETPCYSIENLYVSQNSFREILTNGFHLSEVSDKDVFELCYSLYQKRQEEFHNAVCLFNAWYACLMDVRNATGEPIGVNLDERLPKDFVKVSLDSVTCTYDIETIKNTFPDAHEVEESVLAAKISEFEVCNRASVFRGKYELQFLIDFIRILLSDSQREKTVIKNKVKFAFGDASSIGQSQALVIFSAYAETPGSLTAYLKTVTQ